jgi:uncharacterized protein YggE
MFSRIVTLAACLAALACAGPARAEEASAGKLSADGQATVKPVPSAMRIMLKLSAKGKNVDEAFANFQKVQRAAADQLMKLGADRASIKVDGYKAAAVTPGAEQARRRQFSFNPMRPMAGKPKKPETSKEKSVSALLQAEFPVPAGGDAESLVLAGQKLQAQIAEAKLASPSGDAKDGAKEESEQDENQADDTGQPQRDPNMPVLLFVARCSPEEQSKAMAEAYGKARGKAEESAAAAKVTLGSPVSVSSSVNQGTDYPGDYYQLMNGDQDYSFAYSMMQPKPGGTEAFAASPDRLVVTVSVMAMFRIQSGEAAASVQPTRSVKKGK